MKPVHRKFLLIPIILAIAGVATFGLSKMKPEAPKQESNDLDLLVDVFELKTSTQSFAIRSQGTVRPRTETILSAEVSGSIVSISPKFIAGGVFRKDEVLMRIDPTNYTVAVDRAEALLAQRQIEFDGATKLRSQGYRAESEYASAKSALAAARADVVGARRNLERTYIRLPYEGMVRSKEADIGQFVNPGTRLGITFATDYAEVRLPLTDHDLAFVEIPDPREVTRSGGADGPLVTLTAVQKGQLTEWDAQIVRTEGVVDEKSRVTYAVARIVDPYRLHSAGPSLPIGTFVAASIEGSNAVDVIPVPRGALRGADQVLVVNEDNEIEIRTVDILRADTDFAYLTAGVSAGEQITTTAIEAPTNGMTVRTDTEDDRSDSPGGARVASQDAEE
ncbi:MAG: efflux RND transporter periplasmic adaptor subunit [Gammaproteobacteria bacterium]|nr:efflux RND transporter periplasmic adaptor subunit [Gammaproteobacteria bacterium]